MDSADDTGVFSPPVTTRIIARDQNVDNERDEAESDGTDVFSPDVSLQSGLVKSLRSNDSKENTPPVTQIPLTQHSGKRKRGNEVENPEVKRKKRFNWSAEESVDNSKSDDIDILSSGNNVAASQDENKIKRKKGFVIVSNTPDKEDSSNYSDLFAKQISTYDHDFHDEQKDVAENERSDILSPNDASLQSGVVGTSEPIDNEENAPPVTQMPSSSQQSDIESIFDDFENQEVERKKRFQLSAEESVDNSKNYTDLSLLRTDAAASQNENKIMRKKGFVVASDTPDNSNYSDLLDMDKSASQVRNRAARKPPFISPSFEDSLQLLDVFKSSSKNKKRTHKFTTPKSPVSQGNRYSEALKSSQDDKKAKRNPRFIALSSSEDNTRYSDIFDCVPKSQNKTKRNRAFADPVCSQESEDSHCSGLFDSTPTVVDKVKRKTRFVSFNTHESEDDSLGYLDISVAQNKTAEKKLHFVDTTKDSLHYSHLILEQSESSIAKKRPFVDPASQTSENDTNYSALLISENESSVEKRRPFVDPTSQEINDHLNYTDVISKNENTGCAANATNQYSALCENSHNSDQPKSEKSSGFNFTSVRSICIDTLQSSPNVSLQTSDVDSLHYSDVTISNDETDKTAANDTDDQSASCETSQGNDRQSNEKSNGSDFTSVRSICIDTFRNSNDISLPPSSAEVTSKPINFTYDVSTSAFCQLDDIPTSINTDFPSQIGSPKSVPVISAANLTYDVPSSAFNQREHVSLPENINMSRVNESKNNSILNLSDERTLVSSNSLEEANESDTLIESKIDTSNTQESAMVIDESADENESSQKFSLVVEESKDESDDALESCSVHNESENKNFSTLESASVTSESENEPASKLESNSLPDKSVNETGIPQKYFPATDKSETECIDSREPVSNSDKTLCPAENSKNQYDEIPESNVDPAIPAQSTLMNTISNSSNLPASNEKIVEESVYVAFNPSSLMLSVTELVDASPEDQTRHVSSAEIKSTQSENQIHSPSDSQSNELPSSALPSAEENIKDHDYAMAHVSNMEVAVENPIAEVVVESSEKSVTVEIPSPSAVEILKDSAETPDDVLFTGEIPQESNVEEIARVSSPEKVPEKHDDAAIAHNIEKIGEESAKTSTGDIPSPKETPKKQPSPNASSQSANYSLRSRKSLPLQQPLVTVENPDTISSPMSTSNVNQSRKKSPAPTTSLNQSREKSPIPTANANQSREKSVSNDLSQKSNRSLRSRNSRSASIQSDEKSIASIDFSQKSTRSKRSRSSQKTPEPVPSSSAAAMNDTDGGLFNDSNPVSGIAMQNFTEASSRAGSYSSRSRNSTSSNTQTFASRSSVSVFSISKIGRPSSAPHEFKVPEVPKVVPKKKKKNDPSFNHLPSKPNFPKFDFYCNKRFYDYLTSKMEPKFGIRTNNEAVKLARYISEVVREVIAMKTGDHHILVEEMKKVLFRKGIVTTHYNFYIFCMDYMPPWFRRKAVPMMQPVNCPPNVTFNLQVLFDSIE
ncbi:kinesin-related protein 4-like [Planococcus citri]|uniref:kinesin-related protein 4-like n=1 Tax=Planococcus citri TaxID=170843 RepID=UPI0031F7F42E